MVSTYHNIVERGIILLGEEWIKSRKAKKVFKGNKKPLSIVDYYTKYVINYQPDIYYVLRNNKKLIFEILDSEEKKQDIIIADVIRSFLIENVEALIFVYSGTEVDEKRIMEALVTIAKGLVYKGIKDSDIPFERSGTLLIKRHDASTPENVKKILQEKLE